MGTTCKYTAKLSTHVVTTTWVTHVGVRWVGGPRNPYDALTSCTPSPSEGVIKVAPATLAGGWDARSYLPGDSWVDC
jgi:hypothetical protein